MRTRTFLELTRQPDLFRQQVQASPRGGWIVVDEVQRMPALLNEVHVLRVLPLKTFLKELAAGNILG